MSRSPGFDFPRLRSSIRRVYAQETSEAKPHFEVLIHPYRSLGPAGFRSLLGVVIATNGPAAIVMLWLGAWPALGFMGLDIVAATIAFRLSYGQARAFERVMIDDDALVVERVDAKGRKRAWKFLSVLFSTTRRTSAAR